MADVKTSDLIQAEAAEATPTPAPAEDTKKERTLLEQWHRKAYDQNADKQKLRALWDDYFASEKAIYKELLADPDTEVKGSVKDLAEKYGISVEKMVGFLDGINESLVTPNPIETMDEETEVSLAFDKKTLYQKMVEARADWLYELPEWDAIFTKDEQHELFLAQRKSGTIVKEKKIGRNDPCPCGSGKKYKHCCGRGK